MINLVTGVTGLVGNNVVRLLLERGERVRVMARSSSDPRPLEGLDVEVVSGDVRSAGDAARACVGVDCVIHAAGWVHIGWRGGEMAQAINVEGTRNMAAAARRSGAKFVHVSSVDAVGLGTPAAPSTEETPPGGKPACPYVVTKTDAERVVGEQIAAGLHATIVNPGFMLGPWDWKPSSGRMLLAVARHWAPVTPTGGCSVCDVRDVAQGILAAREQGQVGRRYILAGFNLSYYRLWRSIARVTQSWRPLFPAGPLMRIAGGAWGDLRARLTGREPDLNSAAVRMSGLRHFYSSARAQAELGYTNRELDETIADAWQWFRTHGYA